MTETRKISCINCNQEFEVLVPEHEIINAEKVSAVVLIHPEKAKCLVCGQPYEFFIVGLKKIEYGWRIVDQIEDREAGIITPPKKIII